MAHKTVNASEASYEVLEQVKKDQEDFLKISVSMSDAINIACSAYFELKKIKEAVKESRKPGEGIDYEGLADRIGW